MNFLNTAGNSYDVNVSVCQLLEENIVTFVKNKLKKFKEVLSPERSERLRRVDEVMDGEEAFLNITLHFLRKIGQQQLADALQSSTLAGICQRKLQSNLKNKFQCLLEGTAQAGNTTFLNQVYTELYITEGNSRKLNDEHEVRQIEAASQKPSSSETTIRCEDMFKPVSGRYEPVRTLMTRGVAGIGKTVLTQKFILDWAEDKANHNIEFVFPFAFRELNLMRNKNYSLVELLHHLFPETKEAGICRFDAFQVLFIFDGLDECRLPLDFKNNEILTDVTESTSVDVLLTNLIRGKLLPSARFWITTRPAAANQIPPECVGMVTEVRGFTDPQKEEYFRMRFRDEEQASSIVSHIETSRSLHIMCHIPVFCWITATVLEDVLKVTETAELPKTLTEMYIHFLIFKDKRGLNQDKVFSFLHLSVQEFLAALYAFQTFINTGVNLLKRRLAFKFKNLFQSAVDESLQSPNGHLDLFVRFLLGLSVKSNQALLLGLLKKKESKPQVKERLVQYIKSKIQGNLPPERSINLFHCLNELNDHSLVEEIQHYLRSGNLSKNKLSPSQWSALVFILLSSQKDLDVFDLKKFFASEEGLLRLLPVVKASKTSL
ncbi:hypothetical protein PAMA_000816 [Pampus argenteus]